ncbi:MAG: HEAT repeat domain-containing protein [Nitrospirota bacterium]|nr:HEAT repeat domain-containing protein [Nitrospirota bacterium]
MPLPHLAWLLSPVLIAGLWGCGPAASEHTTNQAPRASVSMWSQPQPIVRPAPLPISVALHAPPTLTLAPAPTAQEEPPQPEQLIMPVWIAQALEDPDASVRLLALDKLAQQGSQAPLEPLIVALDDEDDGVRTKAMAIIEQNWEAEQQGEPEVEK